MYPAPFSYHRPGSLDEAVSLLSELGEAAKPLAGGQSLIPILKLRMDEPSDLVDIARLPGLHFMQNDDGNVRIGALSTHARIGRSELASAVPILGDCANGIADPQVRARGTIGGSVSSADPSCDWPTLLHTLDAEIVCHGKNGNRSFTHHGNHPGLLNHSPRRCGAGNRDPLQGAARQQWRRLHRLQKVGACLSYSCRRRPAHPG